MKRFINITKKVIGNILLASSLVYSNPIPKEENSPKKEYTIEGAIREIAINETPREGIFVVNERSKFFSHGSFQYKEDMNFRIDWKPEAPYPVEEKYWNYIKECDINKDNSITLPELITSKKNGSPSELELKIATLTDILVNTKNKENKIRSARELLKMQSHESMNAFLHAYRCIGYNEKTFLKELNENIQDEFNERNVDLFVQQLHGGYYKNGRKINTLNWNWNIREWLYCGGGVGSPLLKKDSFFLDLGFTLKNKIFSNLIKKLEEKERILDVSQDYEYAILQMGRIGDPKAIPYIALHLKDSTMWTRDLAMEAIGMFKEDVAVKTLIDFLYDEKFDILHRNHPGVIVDALANTKSQLIIPVFIDLIEKRRNVIESQVIRYLGEYKNPMAIPCLIKCLRDPLLRKEARLALQTIDTANYSRANNEDKKEILTLEELLTRYFQSTNNIIREAALYTSEYIIQNRTKYQNINIKIKPMITFEYAQHQPKFYDPLNPFEIPCAFVEGTIKNIPNNESLKLALQIETDKIYEQSYVKVTNNATFLIRGLWGGNGNAILSLYNPDEILVYECTIPHEIDYKKKQIVFGTNYWHYYLISK